MKGQKYYSVRVISFKKSNILNFKYLKNGIIKNKKLKISVLLRKRERKKINVKNVHQNQRINLFNKMK